MWTSGLGDPLFSRQRTRLELSTKVISIKPQTETQRFCRKWSLEVRNVVSSHTYSTMFPDARGKLMSAIAQGWHLNY